MTKGPIARLLVLCDLESTFKFASDLRNDLTEESPLKILSCSLSIARGPCVGTCRYPTVTSRARHAHMVLGARWPVTVTVTRRTRRAAGAHFHNGLPSTQAHAAIIIRSDQGGPCGGWGVEVHCSKAIGPTPRPRGTL